MGKTRKKKTHEKLVGRKRGKGKSLCSPQFPSALFSCLRFLNSADPTISEPGTGYIVPWKEKVHGLWNKIFMGIFRSTLHVFFLFLWPLWLNHTHSKTDDITRSRRELDQQGAGGGGGTGGLGGNVETPLNLIYCHQFFLLFLLKCAEEPWKGTLYSLIFFTSNIKHLHPALQSCKQDPV